MSYERCGICGEPNDLSHMHFVNKFMRDPIGFGNLHLRIRELEAENERLRAETERQSTQLRLSTEAIIHGHGEIERLRRTIGRVWSEINAQPHRHMDAPCTDRCVNAVCDDVRKALEQPTTGAA